jgi:hypothetical protein
MCDGLRAAFGDGAPFLLLGVAIWVDCAGHLNSAPGGFGASPKEISAVYEPVRPLRVILIGIALAIVAPFLEILCLVARVETGCVRDSDSGLSPVASVARSPVSRSPSKSFFERAAPSPLHRLPIRSRHKVAPAAQLLQAKSAGGSSGPLMTISFAVAPAIHRPFR